MYALYASLCSSRTMILQTKESPCCIYLLLKRLPRQNHPIHTWPTAQQLRLQSSNRLAACTPLSSNSNIVLSSRFSYIRLSHLPHCTALWTVCGHHIQTASRRRKLLHQSLILLHLWKHGQRCKSQYHHGHNHQSHQKHRLNRYLYHQFMPC